MTDTKIKVLYFAQVAELLDKREELWPARPDLTVEKLLDELCTHYSALEPLKERLQVAINHYHAQPGDTVSANDEVARSEEHTSELQSRGHLVCRLLLEKKNEKRHVSVSIVCR